VLTADRSINWALSNANSQVGYDHDLAAQGLTRVRIQAGRLFLDDAHTNPLDTAGMVTHFSGPGRAIYVMSKEGNLHVTSHKIGIRHHTSPLAGQNVAAAGEMAVNAGNLTWLSNKSGHYAPRVEHLLRSCTFWPKRAITCSFASAFPQRTRPWQGTCRSRSNVSRAPTTFFTESTRSPNRFLDDFDQYDVADYDLLKLLAYQHHFDEALFASRGWRWARLFDRREARLL